jgi:4-amino-4-deoxy-L-arabinose transferase-like glycosyltransferase
MSRRTAARPPAAKAPGKAPAPRPPAAAAKPLAKRAPAARPRGRDGLAARARGESPPSARSALGRIPAAAWLCALIACLNAACWSVLTPPFEVPDEPSHFAYVEHLAETSSLPSSSAELFTPAEGIALEDLHLTGVSLNPENGTISTPAEQRKLEHDLAQGYPRSGNSNAGVATAEPPLYYTLETIPYSLASSGNVLDQLALMRLLSALMGGLTALFVYLFVREALPGEPWAWTVGGLGVAVMPLLGLMSGAVNPDALLFAVSAALFYCLARAFRRGLTPRLAAALGAVIVLGLMTKLNFIGLLPGAILGLLVLCAREARTSRRAAYRCLALAGGVAASPILLYVLINVLSGRLAFGTVSAAISLTGHASIAHELSYIWQFYLPRLPGMSPDFPGLSTTRVFWFDGLVGLYGWLDTTFPAWVYNAALLPAALIAALAARALYLHRHLLRSRLSEAAVYLAITLGVLLVIGADDYVNNNPGEYREPRYLLPMLALWGLTLTLAARGAGRRWGRPVGAAIVVLLLAHNLFSQLLVISRYYG